MGKQLISDLRKITVAGILNAEEGKVENEGEVIDLKELFEQFDGYDVEIKLSVEKNIINEEENESE